MLRCKDTVLRNVEHSDSASHHQPVHGCVLKDIELMSWYK
jgi:hypothetical protein